MTESKRPLKVFLCHAHADRDAVRTLYNRLIKDGVDAWLDKEKLLPGQDWELEIRKAVRESDVVVVCLSRQFNQAGFRQKEVRLALDAAMEKPEGEIFIIPARWEECDVLEDLQRWHWVDLFESDGYENLIRALQARANKVSATLQIHKGWLPNITLPRSKLEKPAEEKTVASSTNSSEKAESKEKTAQEKAQREVDEFLRKNEQRYKRGLFWIDVQYKVESFIAEIRYRLKLLRINFVPILIILVTLSVIIPLLIELSNKIPELTRALNSTPQSTQVPTETLMSSEFNTPISTFAALSPGETPQPNSAPTKTPTPVPTSLSTEITDAKGVPMVLVQAGNFMMGSNTGDPDERPAQTIYLDSFYIDRFEVTNAFYKDCVDMGACDPPVHIHSNTRTTYYGNTEFNNYPVIYVNWYMAKSYCEWRGARLPTEAEWEKAARGTNGRTYPWGENIDETFANYNSNNGDTTVVGSYEKGKSVYGVYDMAGNVWEWVSSLYRPYPYSATDGRENLTIKDSRVLRGGSWYYGSDRLLTFFRSFSNPIDSGNNVGFRCARNANP
jgi:formylglycine-generating enzyme required for sulfatase activity